MRIVRYKNALVKWIYIIIAVFLIVIIGASYVFLSSPTTSNTKTQNSNSVSVTSIPSTTIKAGGSTFINPQMQKWITDFSSKYPSISVTYDSVGSGTGVSRFIQGVYDIGASDVPPPTEQWRQAVQKYGAIITIPAIVGSIGIIYNIPGFNPSINGPLNMTAEILAKIYTGKIQYWDDHEIIIVNPGFKFPHEKIIAVHRSDGSGTTFVFTLYLQKAAKNIWTLGADYTIQWPVDQIGNGLGGKGSEGVSAYVSQNPYSIGYVEYQYAVLTKLQTAQLKNYDGYFVPLTKNNVLVALNNIDFSKIPKATDDWSNVSGILLDLPGRDTYPIVSFSYLVIKKDYQDTNKAIGIYLFLKYIIMNQNVLEGYLPLPNNVINYIINNELTQITVNGQPVYKILTG